MRCCTFAAPFTERASTSLPAHILTNKEEKTPSSKTRPICSFCKMFGNVKDDYRKLEHRNKQTAEPVKSEPVVNQLELSPSETCFGCGAPDVIRSNCTVCKEKRSAPTTATAFQSVSVGKVSNLRVRPIFHE